MLPAVRAMAHANPRSVGRAAARLAAGVSGRAGATAPRQALLRASLHARAALARLPVAPHRWPVRWLSAAAAPPPPPPSPPSSSQPSAADAAKPAEAAAGATTTADAAKVDAAKADAAVADAAKAEAAKVKAAAVQRKANSIKQAASIPGTALPPVGFKHKPAAAAAATAAAATTVASATTPTTATPATPTPATAATTATAGAAGAGAAPSPPAAAASASAASSTSAVDSAGPVTAATPSAATTAAVANPSTPATAAGATPAAAAGGGAGASGGSGVNALIRTDDGKENDDDDKHSRAWKFLSVAIPHFGNALAAVAVLASDVLWLRTFYLLANFCSFTLNYYILQPRFWTGVYWSCFFILANVIQIFMILADRNTAVNLSEEEQQLYDDFFQHFCTKLDFKCLCGAGEFVTLQPNTRLIERGKRIETIHVLISGHCLGERPADGSFEEPRGGEADKPAMTAVTIPAGRFVGELGGLLDRISASSVTTLSECRAFRFDKAKLAALCAKRPTLALVWTSVCSNEAMAKLLAMNVDRISNAAAYELLLRGVTSDGVVSRDEARVCEEIRHKLGVTDVIHAASLAHIGWNEHDWRRGRRL